jgi:uncharacterized protein YjiS (DUF1127 family)
MTLSIQECYLPRRFAPSQLPLVRIVATWLRYRKNLHEIAGLDEHTLRDIGANQAELRGYAWRDACGERCARGGHA